MGLRAGDLNSLVDDVFEIDSFQSKMGADKNIITLSFSVANKEPADDLVKFLEGGYPFILDADATAGEQADGTYKVFVELEREKGANDNIMEIIDGVKKLSGIQEFRYRYYKSFKSQPVSIDSLNETVPLDPDQYGSTVVESNLNNYKNFFNKSYVDEVSVKGNVLTISKPYADPLRFEILDFGDSEDTLSNITESFDVDGFAEILFLAKYLGDYNISKYVKKITLENAGKLLVANRLS